MFSIFASGVRYSLRHLLAAMVGVAVVGAAYRAWGVDGFVGAGFGMATLAPIFVLRGSARRAYLIAYAAVYGPFLVMATYALGWVECTHCKAASWAMLPYGPAIVPLELLSWALDLPHDWGRLGPPILLVASVGMVLVVMGVITGRSTWWQTLVATLTLAACGFFAFGLLALIRA